MIPIPKIVKLIDLTDLTGLPDSKDISEPNERIFMLCKDAITPVGNVAAVCVYPQHVTYAKKTLQNTHIFIATVVNFPTGDEPLNVVESSIKNSLACGADEIDVVMPYKHLIEGDLDYVAAFLMRCRELTKNCCLKVIIESGLLTKEQIMTTTSIVCDVGANFVKTSTGKVQDKGATLEAVETILSVLAKRKIANQKYSGLKISGGVTQHNIQAYLSSIQNIMGSEWITPENVRIGASSLLQGLLAEYINSKTFKI